MSETPSTGHERAADRELVTSRVIAAPRSRVYAAFADPAQLARWWGPAGFTNSFETFDLRPGGSWRFDNVRAYLDYLVCESQPTGWGTGTPSCLRALWTTGMVPATKEVGDRGRFPRSRVCSRKRATGTPRRVSSAARASRSGSDRPWLDC